MAVSKSKARLAQYLPVVILNELDHVTLERKRGWTFLSSSSFSFFFFFFSSSSSSSLFLSSSSSSSSFFFFFFFFLAQSTQFLTL